MKREIKFRGQKNSTKEMIYGSLIVNTKGDCTITKIGENPVSNGQLQYWCFGVITETVGQFTERKDNNGVEIYEDDIVNAHIQNMDFEAVVKWGKGSWSLKCDRRNREKWGTIKYYKLPHSDNIEVIGNIYETE